MVVVDNSQTFSVLNEWCLIRRLLWFSMVFFYSQTSLVLNGCSWFSMVVLDSQTSLVLNGGGGQCTQIGPKH